MNRNDLEKFWLMINKHRGSAEHRDIVFLVMFAMVLQKLEWQKQLTDEKYTLRYLSLTYGELMQGYDLAEYLPTISNMLTSITTQFLYIEKKMEEISGKDIRNIFTATNNLNLNIHNLIDIAVYLLEKANLITGRFMSECSTNLSLAKLEAEIINCKEGMSIYDGCCGQGMSISIASNGKGIIHAQERDNYSAAIASMLILLSVPFENIGSFNITDTLLTPATEEKFDIVIMEPPFGHRYDRNMIEHFPSNNFAISLENDRDSESLFIRHALAKLKETGTAMLLLPMGFFFRQGNIGKLRKMLVDNNLINAIIELPAGLLNGTYISTALLVLKYDNPDNIFMINASSFYEKNKNVVTITDEQRKKIITCFNERPTIEGICRSITLEEIKEKEYNLCTQQYVVTKTTDLFDIKDTAECIKRNKTNMEKLVQLEKELNELRDVFVK